MNYFKLQKELLKRDWLLEMEKKFAEQELPIKPNPMLTLLEKRKCKLEQEMETITKSYDEADKAFKKYKESVNKEVNNNDR